MSTETVEKPLGYEEEKGQPRPSTNHGAIQANLIGEFRTLSELTLATDPVTGLTADLAAVFS